MKTEINELIKKIEDLGWTVYENGDSQYLLTRYSPAGQEFSINIKGEDVETLIDSINTVYENFDVSEETYLWLDNSGHGINGAPYEMKDVLADMETCEQRIKDLYDALTKE